MKNFATVAAFAAGAHALVGRDASCCFHLSASGGAQGSLGQLDDGQNRIGGGLGEAQFCIDSSGAITDANGRGCILTGPTSQFQCDEGSAPTPGFSINSQGQLEYQGNTDFVACETGMNGGLNIYTEQSDAVTGCKDVNMSADTCSGSGAGGSNPSSSAPASSVPASSPAPRPTSSAPAPSGSPSGPGAVPGTSSVPVVPVVPGSSKSQVTVWTTQTSTECNSESTVPAVPIETPSGGAQPSGPPSGGAQPTPSGGAQPTPSGGAQPTPSGGAQPSGPHSGGSQPSGPPSGGSQPTPSGGAQPSGTPSGGSQPTPSGGAQPSGTPSGGVQPSGTGSGSQPSETAPSSSGSCPTNLDGEYTAPHLILPVDSNSPDTAPGTSYNGTISSSLTTLYNFDVPQSYSDKTCSLVFLFPKQEDLETSAFTFSGDGQIDFASLESPVTEDTSYSSIPSVKEDYGVTTVSPGNSYVISTFDCPAGQPVSYEMKNAGSTYLDFFEDYNPSPLGLYITTC